MTVMFRYTTDIGVYNGVKEALPRNSIKCYMTYQFDEIIVLARTLHRARLMLKNEIIKSRSIH